MFCFSDEEEDDGEVPGVGDDDDDDLSDDDVSDDEVSDGEEEVGLSYLMKDGIQVISGHLMSFALKVCMVKYVL